MTRELDTEVRHLCGLVAITMVIPMLKLAKQVAEATNSTDIESIQAEIAANVLAASMYGVVCIANGVTEPTAEPLNNKGDITERVIQKIKQSAFKIMNDELNDTTPHPSHN